MSADVIDISSRLRVMSSCPKVLAFPGLEVTTYERAAIHEGVPVAQLVRALNQAGLTVSTIKGHGLVIHRIGQDPERPDPASPLNAS